MQLYMSQVRQPRPIFGPTYNWNIFPAKSSNNYNPKRYDSLFFSLASWIKTQKFLFAFPHSLCCIPAKLLCGSRPRLFVWRDGSVCGSTCDCVWLCVVVWVFVTVCGSKCGCVWVYMWLCVGTLKVVCAATTQHSRQTRTQGMFVLQWN